MPGTEVFSKKEGLPLWTEALQMRTDKSASVTQKLLADVEHVGCI